MVEIQTGRAADCFNATTPLVAESGRRESACFVTAAFRGDSLWRIRPVADSSAQVKIPRVGILTSSTGTTDKASEQFDELFRRTLADQGWIDGKNVVLEYRAAHGTPPRFADTAAELVRLNVDVIFANNAPATRAASAATHTIPIVGVDLTNDPVSAGYVESYTHPGGNLTGFFLDAPEFAGKLLELLRLMVPGLSRAVVLWDPSPGPTHLSAVQAAARSFEIQLQVLEVRKPEEIDGVFSGFRGRPQALIILPSPMLFSQGARLAELALQHRLPATSIFRPFAEAGGVIAYGPELVSAGKRCAGLVAKILGGAKPAELPVERPAKFELVVNLRTAKAIGLALPQSILLRADEVIR
jgi:putative ABC transport system substrate-binding protein